MKKFFKRLLTGQRGDALIITALSLVGLLGMAGLALDGGLIFMRQSALQKAANAAVLSGAQELTNSEENVEQVVQNIIAAHNDTNDLADMQITMNKQVGIDLAESVKLNFLSLLGFKQINVKVHAAAGLSPMGSAAGAAPLGIDQSTPLVYGQTYQLKVDTTGVDSGNFGILALGSNGARTYEDNLINGYQNELKIGDIVNTQTGNIAGDTRDAIQERIDSCTAAPGDYTQRDCSRILLVPVYVPYQYSSNQLKSVKITGFAYFYITTPMSSTDTSITGMFIQRAGTGYYEPGSVDMGAYCIRLTE